MKRAYLIGAGCLLLAAASPAMAVDGLYMGFEGGATFANDADAVGTGASRGVSFTTEYDTGFVAGGFIGYRFQSMRFEAELAYRQNDWSDITNARVAGVGTVASFEAAGIGVNGETSVLSGMANLYLDWHNYSHFVPYLMAGVGLANVEIDNFTLTSGGVTLAATDEDDTVVAWQVGVGIGYIFNELVSLNLDYRYFATADPEFADTDFEYDSHNLMASLLFHF